MMVSLLRDVLASLDQPRGGRLLRSVHNDAWWFEEAGHRLGRADAHDVRVALGKAMEDLHFCRHEAAKEGILAVIAMIEG